MEPRGLWDSSVRLSSRGTQSHARSPRSAARGKVASHARSESGELGVQTTREPMAGDWRVSTNFLAPLDLEPPAAPNSGATVAPLVHWPLISTQDVMMQATLARQARIGARVPHTVHEMLCRAAEQDRRKPLLPLARKRRIAPAATTRQRLPNSNTATYPTPGARRAAANSERAPVVSSGRSPNRRKGLGESLLADALARTQCITSTGSGIGLFVTAAVEHAATGYQRFGWRGTPGQSPSGVSFGNGEALSD